MRRNKMKKLTAILLILIVSAAALFAGDRFMEDWKFGAEYQPVQGTYGVTVEIAPVGNANAYVSVGINDAYGKAGFIVHPKGHPVGFYLGGGLRAVKEYEVITREGSVSVDGEVEVSTVSTGSVTVPFGFWNLHGTSSSSGYGYGGFEGSGDFTYEDMVYTGVGFQGIGELGLHVNFGNYAAMKMGGGWYGDAWGANLAFTVGY